VKKQFVTIAWMKNIQPRTAAQKGVIAAGVMIAAIAKI